MPRVGIHQRKYDSYSSNIRGYKRVQFVYFVGYGQTGSKGIGDSELE